MIAEYRRSDQADHVEREERVLVLIPQPYPNHNGGMIAFGPDGYFYIGMGDVWIWGRSSESRPKQG